MDCSKRRVSVDQYTICRLCLCSSNSLSDVFKENDEYGFVVREAIEDLLQFEVSNVNGSPWLICATCVEKLNEFRMFKSRCCDAKIAFENRFPEQCMPRTQQNKSGKQPQRVIILPITHSSALSNIDNLPSCPPFLSEALRRLPQQFIDWNGPRPCNEEIDPRDFCRTEICRNKDLVILPNRTVNEGGGDSLDEKSLIRKLISSHESGPATNETGINVKEPQIQYVHPTDSKDSAWSNGKIPSCKSEPKELNHEIFIEDEKTPSKEEIGKVISPNSGSGKSEVTKAKEIVSKMVHIKVKSPSLLNKPVVIDSASGKRECETTASNASLGAKVKLVVSSEETRKNSKELVNSDIMTLDAMSDSSDSCSDSEDDGLNVSKTCDDHVSADVNQSSNNSEFALPKPYKCELCEKRFRWKEKFDKHMLLHPAGMKPFKCSQCSKSYTDKRSVRRHMLSHSRIPKILECTECDMTFTRLNALKNHKKTHVKELLQCEICKKTFKHRATRSRHMKIHVQGKAFICQECGKSFSFRYDLTNHLRGHTNQKPYLCEVCGKGFNKPQYLRYHLQVHAEVKRHTCAECGKAFAQYSALWQHRKWHQGEKRFVCEVCSKGFVLNSQLVQHRKKHAIRVDTTSAKSIVEPS